MVYSLSTSKNLFPLNQRWEILNFGPARADPGDQSKTSDSVWFNISPMGHVGL